MTGHAILYVGLVLIVLVAAAGMVPLKRYADREWRRHQRIETYRAALKAGALSINEVRVAMGQVGAAARGARISVRAFGDAIKMGAELDRAETATAKIHGATTDR